MKVKIISNTLQLTPENESDSVYLNSIYDTFGFNVYKSWTDYSIGFTLIYNLEKKLEIN